MTSTMSPPPPPPSDPPPYAPPETRLTRSSDDRMVAGVAGGIARHFGYDPALVRLAIATLGIITFGTAFAAYVVAWLVIPQDDGRVIANELRDRAENHRSHRHPRSSRRWLAIGLLVIGLIALSDEGHWWPSRVFGPLVLIAIGCLILLSHRDNSAPASPSEPTSAPPPSEPWADTGPVVGATDPTPLTDTAAPQTSSAFPHGTWPGSTHTYPMRSAHGPHRHHREQRSVLSRLVLSVVALAIGGAWLLDAANAVDVNPMFIAALTLSILGGGLIIGAFVGRARVLVLLAILLTVGCTAATAIDIPMEGGLGDRVERPTTVAQAERRYKIAVGELHIDLTGVEGTGPLNVFGQVGIGRISVEVPADASVTVIGDIDLGAITTFDRHDDGGYHRRLTTLSQGSGRSITITLTGGIGELHVERSYRSALATPTIEEANV